jgi:protein TonB
MRAIAIAAAVMLMGAAPTHVISMPDWAATPVGADLAAAYPPAALAARIGGEAEIACVTTAEGFLTDCAVLAEQPAGAGFGAAAVTLAGKFRMKPITRDGAPVAGGQVRIPIRFSPGPPPGAASRPSVVTTSE